MHILTSEQIHQNRQPLQYLRSIGALLVKKYIYSLNPNKSDFLPRLMSNISSSGNMGRKKFTSVITILMIVPLFLTVISTSQATSIAGVSFSNDSISISPENPVSGTPISIKLTLNNSNTEISEVDVYFYKNSYEAGKEWKIEHVFLDASDGVTDSQTNITVIWQDVNTDDDGIFIRVYDSGSDTFSPSVFKSFSVQGLPDLIIENVEISPNSNIHENELFYANVTILNQGTEISESNSVELNIEGSGISETIGINALDADSSTIISFESLAPQTGTWTIQISVDSNYEINELKYLALESLERDEKVITFQKHLDKRNLESIKNTVIRKVPSNNSVFFVVVSFFLFF